MNHYTARQAREKVRDATYLAEVKRAMKDDPIGRANVPPEVVTALIDALDDARESNRHNFAVAQAALAGGGATGTPAAATLAEPEQATDESSAGRRSGQRQPAGAESAPTRSKASASLSPGSASAAADEPRKYPKGTKLWAPAADEPGETP